MTQHELKDELYSKNDVIDIAIRALEDLKTEQALRRIAETQLDAQKELFNERKVAKKKAK